MLIAIIISMMQCNMYTYIHIYVYVYIICMMPYKYIINP